MAQSKFVVTANRLPVHGVRRKGKTVWETSPGGLVSALVPFLRERKGTWVGWSGGTDSAPKPFVHEGIRNVAVSLSASEINEFYEGFSNRTLWPLYHDVVRPPVFRRAWWRSYVEVNRRFAAAVDSVAAKNATVWVHDYHLQLVPRLLREVRPDLEIGFFLHIPFPPQELFARMPWRVPLLDGFLGSDLVGFQTRVGAQNFARLARRYRGAKGARGELEIEGRKVRYGSFPISIDVDRFERLAGSEPVRERTRALRRELGERSIVLGVDRLDYTKGIDIRLRAFGELLSSGRLSTDDCVMVQTAVPSREKVREYVEVRERVERLVGTINGEFSRIGQVAVSYMHRNLQIEDLVALYRAADMMLVTPLRDGMNLVSKEFVATRLDDSGVLVLSEFTGAARELRQALLVNPYDIAAMSNTIHRGLTMADKEKRRRMRALRARVKENDVHHWAKSFLDTLHS